MLPSIRVTVTGTFSYTTVCTFFVTLYLQNILDYTPDQTGLVFLALSIPFMAMSLIVGRLVLSNRRARPKAGVPRGAEGPSHDPFEHGSVTERRSTTRRKGNPVEVLITDAEAEAEPWRGWVVDRSMGGLCLLLHDEVASGSTLGIKPRSAPPATPWVQLEVRSCKKERAGYQVGCQFVRTPPWAVLLLFG